MTIKQLTLSFLLAAGALTATEAQASFTLVSATPASGTTVEKLGTIKTTWSGYDFNQDYSKSPYVTNESDEKLDYNVNVMFNFESSDVNFTVKDADGNGIETAGVYKLCIPEGLLSEYANASNLNEATTLTYTVKPSTELKKLDITFSPDNKGRLGDGQIYDKDFTFVNILMGESGSYEADFSKITFRAGEEEIDCTKAANSNGVSFTGINLTGNYTVTVDVAEGAIFDKAYKDSKGEYGRVNNAATYQYKIIAVNGPDDNGEQLVITKLIVNGVDALAPDATLSVWPKGTNLEVATNKDMINGVSAARLLVMNIIDNNPDDPDQAYIASMRNVRKNADGKFIYSLSGQMDYEFIEGHTYTFEFQAWDTDDVAPVYRKNYGTATAIVKGNKAPYEFSPVTMTKVVPEPGTVITDRGQVIEFYFSAPLSEFNALQNEGNGMTSNVSDTYSNSAKDHWYVKMSNSFVNNLNGTFELIVSGKDANGLVIKGNHGVKEESCEQIGYEAYFDCADLTLATLPDNLTGGEVTSLQKFRGNGAYQLSHVTPLETPTGYYASTINNDRVTQYFEIDGEIKSEAEWIAEGKSDRLFDKQVQYCDIELKREITAPGKYILHAPQGCFSFGDQMSAKGTEEGRFEFLIKGEPTITGQSINNGDKVASINIVSLYSDSYASCNEGTRMNIRKDGSNYVSAPLNIIYNDNGSFIFADFSSAVDSEGNPFVIEDGVEYEIRIGAGALFLPETDMEYKAVNIKFTGSSAAGAPVKLTQNIAGHSTSVTSVAAGATSEIALTPATSWKVGSVKFNDEDVTADVKDNVYTTPALTADSKLDVTFEYDGVLNVTTGADQVVTDFNLTVYSENLIIRVAGLEAGMNVKLYTINGALLSDVDATESTLNFEVDGGAYVLLFTKDGKTEAVKVMNN